MIMAVAITISEEICKGCGICVELCQFKVLTMITDDHSNKPFPRVENIGECVGCGLCEMYCPDFAITVVRQIEEVEIG